MANTASTAPIPLLDYDVEVSPGVEFEADIESNNVDTSLFTSNFPSSVPTIDYYGYI